MCSCGREVPIEALWCALARKVSLRCALCGEEKTTVAIAEAAEHNAHTLAAVTIFCQLVRYGWVSYGSAANAMGDTDPSVLSGMLPGLQRAGLLSRASDAPPAAQVAAFVAVSKPRATFVAGPLFPQVRKGRH